MYAKLLSNFISKILIKIAFENDNRLLLLQSKNTPNSSLSANGNKNNNGTEKLALF